MSVVVPLAGDCPHRLRAFAWVVDRYRALHADWELVQCTAQVDPWCKADAIRNGVSSAHGDVLIIADADVWADEIHVAAAAVTAGAPWAIPHTKVHRLNEAATAQQLEHQLVDVNGRLDRAPYTGVAGGGIVVLRRDAYDDVPLDHRFEGWGGEDHAWGYALTTLLGMPTRCGGRLWHLWHPRQPGGKGRMTANDASARLRRQYQQAVKHPKAMRALVDAGKPEGAQCES